MGLTDKIYNAYENFSGKLKAFYIKSFKLKIQANLILSCLFNRFIYVILILYELFCDCVTVTVTSGADTVPFLPDPDLYPNYVEICLLNFEQTKLLCYFLT